MINKVMKELTAAPAPQPALAKIRQADGPGPAALLPAVRVVPPELAVRLTSSGAGLQGPPGVGRYGAALEVYFRTHPLQEQRCRNSVAGTVPADRGGGRGG
jgi:hypothetical protein